MTFALKVSLVNLFVILFAIQILQFTVEVDAHALQHSTYFFNQNTKMNPEDYEYLSKNSNKNNYYNSDVKSKFMFKRMTPCYYSPIQCLVKKSLKEDYI